MQAGEAEAQWKPEKIRVLGKPCARLRSPSRYDNHRPEVRATLCLSLQGTDRDRAAGPRASTAFGMPEDGRPPPSLCERERGPQSSPWRQAASLQTSPGLALHAGGCRMCPTPDPAGRRTCRLCTSLPRG